MRYVLLLTNACSISDLSKVHQGVANLTAIKSITVIARSKHSFGVEVEVLIDVATSPECKYTLR